MSSPHTRGSTRISGNRRQRFGVFPAHAGIDLTRISPSRSCSCLPRTRGDRPDALGGGSGVVMSSPHTRGSTAMVTTSGDIIQVFPAHAGIDPLPVIRYFMIARLPRTRGDRPIHQVCGNMLALSSPHTRGSTFCAPKDDPRDYVFPAHAGIDLTASMPSGTPSRLPRTRGDRPAGHETGTSRRWSSPHTRGSTQPF